MRKLFLVIALVFITNCFASAVDDIDSRKSEGIGTLAVSNFDTNIFSSVDGVELSSTEIKEVKGDGGWVAIGCCGIIGFIWGGQIAKTFGINDNNTIFVLAVIGGAAGIFVGSIIPVPF